MYKTETLVNIYIFACNLAQGLPTTAIGIDGYHNIYYFVVHDVQFEPH